MLLVALAPSPAGHTLPSCSFLQKALTDRVQEIKMTLAAPNWYHLRYKEGKAYPKDVYANDEEYFADIAAAYRTELKILYDAGLRNAQVDDPNVRIRSNSQSS